MRSNYRCVKFVNLSVSSLGVFSNECSTFLEMMNDIDIDKEAATLCNKKKINLAIRVTYFIFCRRNKIWDSPELIKLYFFKIDSFVNTVYKYMYITYYYYYLANKYTNLCTCFI